MDRSRGHYRNFFEIAKWDGQATLLYGTPPPSFSLTEKSQQFAEKGSSPKHIPILHISILTIPESSASIPKSNRSHGTSILNQKLTHHHHHQQEQPSSVVPEHSPQTSSYPSSPSPPSFPILHSFPRFEITDLHEFNNLWRIYSFLRIGKQQQLVLLLDSFLPLA